MSVQVGQPAPDFTATAVVNGQFEQVKLSQYRGKNVVLFFWPLDFTFVCPTEIVAFSDAVPQFAERNTQVLGASIDSQFVHLAWQKTPRTEGGLGRVDFPMIADTNHSISRAYGVLLDDAGVALRGLFLIDKNGVVRHMLVNDLPLGRSVEEALRVVDALAHFEKHGEVCPANWKPGSKAMKADPQGAKSYFAEWGKK
jgi:alkyl hydroperoxide reductase subunit AhpC